MAPLITFISELIVTLEEYSTATTILASAMTVASTLNDGQTRSTPVAIGSMSGIILRIAIKRAATALLKKELYSKIEPHTARAFRTLSEAQSLQTKDSAPIMLSPAMVRDLQLVEQNLDIIIDTNRDQIIAALKTAIWNLSVKGGFTGQIARTINPGADVTEKAGGKKSLTLADREVRAFAAIFPTTFKNGNLNYREIDDLKVLLAFEELLALRGPAKFNPLSKMIPNITPWYGLRRYGHDEQYELETARALDHLHHPNRKSISSMTEKIGNPEHMPDQDNSGKSRGLFQLRPPTKG